MIESRVGGWINGGFFVFEERVLDYMGGDDIALEREPLERLASENQLEAYLHEGFWQPMDTLHDKRILEALSLAGGSECDELWESGNAPWKPLANYRTPT